jgi:hypothetical protein
MFANPIIRRYGFSQLRPQHIWVFGSVYVCIVILALMINISIYRFGEHGYKTLTDLLEGLFVQFALLEVFLLWLMIPANTANVVSREIVDKSFDFFRMLPLSAPKKAVGILVGRNLLSLLVATVNLMLCLFFANMVGLSAALIGQMLTFLITGAVALSMLGLLSSVITYRRSRVTALPVLVLICMFAVGPVMVNLFDLVHERELETMTVPFFTMNVPILYLVALFASCAAVWAYLGVVRRFTHEYESLLSRPMAASLVLCYITLIYGLFFNYLNAEGVHVSNVWAFWVTTLLPVWVVPLFALRSFDKYLEISRAAHLADGPFKRLLANSNIVSGLSLFAIWLAFAVVICATSGGDATALLWLAMPMLSSYLVVLGLLETYVTCQPKNEKIGYLLGFATIVYFVLPLILGAVFDNEMIYLFSPLGTVKPFDMGDYGMLRLLPVMLNLALVLALGILVRRRYNGLVTTRMLMDKTQGQ